MKFARWVDSFWSKVPVWMQGPNARTFLTTMIAFYDVATDVMRQGMHASIPGIGTTTALPFIGQMRGMIQGDGETNASYAARLPSWRDRARQWGMQLALARALHEYVEGNPIVKIVNRAGLMVTCDASGNITRTQTTWNWDSVSNPERATWWAELWIIIYAPPWNETGPVMTSPNAPPNLGPYGIGQLVPRINVDVVKGLVEQYKSFHSYVRAVIWSYDSSLFDPTNPSKMPDGTWGQWSYPTFETGNGNNARHLSGRSLSCRYWEVERDPNVAT